VPDGTDHLPETCAADGYKGSAEAVASHAVKLAKFEVPAPDLVVARVYEAPVRERAARPSVLLL
jgi:demethoxyubiquinone hydroxylase (CLK1/Coq7/Cat5 family)